MSDIEALLSLPEVERRTSLGRSSIWRGVEAGSFPSPVRISTNRIAWLQSEVVEWMHRLPRADGAKRDAA